MTGPATELGATDGGRRSLHREQGDLDAERAHRKFGVAASLRLLAAHGVTFGAAGHISARDPIDADRFWVNPVLRHFSRIRPDDLLLVDGDGQIVEGDGELNLAAFAIHSRLHRARPDIIGAAHAHSPYGKIWSTTGRLLQPLTQDGCAFFEDHALYGTFGGVVLDAAEGDAIAGALGDRKAIILANHGLLTVGTSVEEAAWWFLAMEDACRTQVLSEAIGTPHAIDDDEARRTREQVGAPLVGRAQFAYEIQAIDIDFPHV